MFMPCHAAGKNAGHHNKSLTVGHNHEDAKDAYACIAIAPVSISNHIRDVTGQDHKQRAGLSFSYAGSA
jgi:hypothetical protein